MSDEELECSQNPHVANRLVLGEDHCGLCYDTVMDFREKLSEECRDVIEDVLSEMSNHRDSVYRPLHKILKTIRGD